MAAPAQQSEILLAVKPIADPGDYMGAFETSPAFGFDPAAEAGWSSHVYGERLAALFPVLRDLVCGWHAPVRTRRRMARLPALGRFPWSWLPFQRSLSLLLLDNPPLTAFLLGLFSLPGHEDGISALARAEFLIPNVV